jgi:hypothetical protein
LVYKDHFLRHLYWKGLAGFLDVDSVIYNNVAATVMRKIEYKAWNMLPNPPIWGVIVKAHSLSNVNICGGLFNGK